MNHRHDDDNFARREREWERERRRERGENEGGRQEGARSSFYPGGSDFDDTHEAGRGSGEHSPPYGQREPYSTSGSGGGTYGAQGYGGFRGEGQGGPHRGRDDNRSYSPQDYSRDIGRDYGRDYGSASGQSRYSESQYGQSRRDRSAGYGQEESWRREPRYGGEQQRYGVGYTGSEGYGRGRSFSNEPFNYGDQPRYYGTGYYGEGTSAFGGGFGEERWGSGPHTYGRFREFERDSRFQGGGSEQYAERPGLLRRLFGKGPKGYQRSDERLREDISERLMQSHSIDSSEVSVTVTSGKVTLEGTVPDRYMKHAIEDLADACPGVQDIDNRIRVDRDAGKQGSGAYGASSGSTTGTSYGVSGTSSGSSSGAGASGTTAASGGQGQTTTKPARRDS